MTCIPGEGVGWFCGPGDACGNAGAGLGCLIFGPGGLCKIPCGLAGVNGLLGGVWGAWNFNPAWSSLEPPGVVPPTFKGLGGLSSSAALRSKVMLEIWTFWGIYWHFSEFMVDWKNSYRDFQFLGNKQTFFWLWFAIKMNLPAMLC